MLAYHRRRRRCLVDVAASTSASVDFDGKFERIFLSFHASRRRRRRQLGWPFVASQTYFRLPVCVLDRNSRRLQSVARSRRRR